MHVTDMGAELVVDELARVDPAKQTAHTEAGRAMPYDALVLALGARPYERYAHALTVDDRHLDDLLHGLIEDVVALPELMGPAIEGVPGDAHGFIPVDLLRPGTRCGPGACHGRRHRLRHQTWRYGCQQADTAALTIAGLAGAPVEPKPFHPEIHGVLMTGRKPRYLSARITGGHGFSSEITDTPAWSPSKIAARYLAPYLDERTS